MDICPYSNLPCNKTKVMHIAEINNNGHFVDFDLCQECSVKYKSQTLDLPMQSFPLDGILDLFSTLINTAIKKVEDPPASKCPGCNSTTKDIINNAKFGCAQCYEYYGNSIDYVLNKCQDGETRHLGKRPKQLPENIEILEKELSKAIEIENYEAAQLIKSKILQIKKKISDS